MKRGLEIIFEDEHLVVLNKPADFLSIPDRFDPDKPNLSALLEKKYGKIFIVHRLDKETSGVICFARTEAAHKHLSMQFQRHETQKIYLALVEGKPYPEAGDINVKLIKDSSRGGKMKASLKHGKDAFTSYKVVERFKRFSLCEAEIKTGRQHQIRVHFKYIGYPLAVDKLYGRRDGFMLSDIKSKYRLGKNQEERPLMSRTTLHAAFLKLTHPHTEEVLDFKAPLHKDFKAILTQLRKWSSIE